MEIPSCKYPWYPKWYMSKNNHSVTGVLKETPFIFKTDNSMWLRNIKLGSEKKIDSPNYWDSLSSDFEIDLFTSESIFNYFTFLIRWREDITAFIPTKGKTYLLLSVIDNVVSVSSWSEKAKPWQRKGNKPLWESFLHFHVIMTLFGNDILRVSPDEFSAFACSLFIVEFGCKSSVSLCILPCF